MFPTISTERIVAERTRDLYVIIVAREIRNTVGPYLSIRRYPHRFLKLGLFPHSTLPQGRVKHTCC